MARKSPAPRPAWQPLLVLAACIVYPSLTEVDKYLGLAGAAVYAAVVLIIVFFGYVALAKGYSQHITARQSWIVAAVILIGLCGLFAVLHPIADVKEPGCGSDSGRCSARRLRILCQSRKKWTTKYGMSWQY